MGNSFDIYQDQITLKKQLWYHFYMGIIFLAIYVLISGPLVDMGYPGLAPLLLVELLVLTPLATAHLLRKGKDLNGRYTFKNVIAYKEKLSVGQYIKWSLLGMLACLFVFIPLYPIGLWIKENIFFWLPEWYFDPGFGSADLSIIAKVFFLGIFIDGIIGPLVEELFFRGYLLPRMAYLKKWAPILNGALFGLYHFWQPHNYMATVLIGIILSWIVWKKKNVYLGIIIHCTLNTLGALAGFLAASEGLPMFR